MKIMSWKVSIIALSISALSACGWEHINETGSNTTVSGVAAVGAPISGGTVELRCVDSYSTSTTTGSDGKWTATVPADALPCNVKVSGGTPSGTFYSVAKKPSGSATTTTANITPLTDLVTAAVVNSAEGRQALEVWFENDSPALRQQVADGFAAGIAQLRTALAAAGYELPSGSFDPFTAAIVPGSAEDLYDLILEAYKQALADADSSYEDARGDYLAGGGLPEADTDSEPVTPSDTALSASETGVRFTTTGKVQGTVETNKLRYWTGPGTVSVGFNPGVLNQVTVSGTEANSFFNLRDVPDAVGTYDCGYDFGSNKANVEIGFSAGNGYNTIGTRGSNGTFTTGFRCSLTITKVGTRTDSGFTGTYEGSVDAQLYKTGQAVNTQDSISVKGHFRIGTPVPVDPVTPSTSTSLFGKSLKSLYVGNYTLKCAPSVGQTVETFAFSIAADGGSTFNGAPLVDSTHPGTVESAGGPESDSMTLTFNAKTGDKNYVVLGFKKDGTFQPNSVNIKSGSSSRTLFCHFTTGNVAPAATSGAPADLKAVASAQARSGTLDCRRTTESDDVKTPTSYSINSDGSAQIAGLNFAAKDLSAMNDAIVFADAAANASTKTASISYSVLENFQVVRSMSVGLGSDLKTTGVSYSSGSIFDPANVHTCSPQ